MRSLLTILTIFCVFSIFAQDATISGRVTDNIAKQPVVGAKIIISSKYKAISDFDGYYSIQNVPFGEHEMLVTMLSFDTVRVNLNINEIDFNYDTVIQNIFQVISGD